MSQFLELDLAKPPLPPVPPAALDVDERPGTVSAKSLFEALSRQRRIFLTVFSVVMLLGALYIFGSHKKYASTMKLLVQNSRGAEVITAGRVEAPAVASEISEEQLNSELEVLQSQDVLDQVIDPRWNLMPPYQRPQAEQQRHEKAVDALRKSLVISPIRKSHLISVQLTTRDPNESTLTLRKLLSAFLSKKRDLNRPAGASQLFAQEADRYKKEWQDAVDGLAKYQQSKKLVSINNQEGGVEKQLFDADTRLRDANVEMAEVEHKIEEDKAELSSVPTRRSTRETAIPAVGSIDQMHSRLSELMLRRTELLTKYKPDDRLVQQVDQEISQINAALSDSRVLYSAETSSDVNPTWQLAEQELSTDRTRLKGVTARRDALVQQVASLQGKLNSTEGETQTFNTLQHKVSELEANYQLYAQKRDEAKMTDAMDAHQLLNVAVAEEPTFSMSPARPRPVTDGILTLITALFMASFAVFVAENNRSTIANERELEAAARYPILATIPMTFVGSARSIGESMSGSSPADFAASE
jgi:uncharacterized protein involved in exopolysaccharide biosynthesis